MHLEFQTSFAYGGENIHAVGGSEVAYICGKGIKFINVETHQERYFWPETWMKEVKGEEEETTSLQKTRGFDPFPMAPDDYMFNPAGTNTICFNPFKRLFAIGEKAISPKIKIYSMDAYGDIEFPLLATIHGGSTIEFNSVNFSRDGRYIVALGSRPDHSLTVWDWSHKEGPQLLAKATCASHSRKVSFNPRDPTQLVTTGIGHLGFWKFENKHIVPIDIPLDGLLEEEIRMKRVHYCHTWGQFNDIYVGIDDNYMLHFSDIHDYGAIMPLPDDQAVNDMTISKHHLILGTDEGYVHLKSLETDEEMRDIRISDKQDGAADVRSIALTADYAYIVAGTADGTLYQIKIDSYTDTSVTGAELLTNNYTVQILQDSHCGFVTDMCLFKNYLLTAGDDGTLRGWDFTSNTLKFKYQLKTAINKLYVYQEKFIFCVSPSGFLRIVELSNENAPQLLFCKRIRDCGIKNIVVSDQSIIVLQFDDHYLGFLYFRTPTAPSTQEDDFESPGIDIDDFDVQLIGYMKSEFAITNVHLEGKQLYVSNEESGLLQLKLPSLRNTASAPEYLLQQELFILKKWKLDYPVYDLVQYENYIITLSMDKSTKIFDLNTTVTGSHHTSIAEVESHLKLGETIALTPNEKYIATGAHDGVLWLRSRSALEADAQFSETDNQFLAKHDPTLGGISKVLFSSDGQYLISCGYDGAIFVYTVKGNRVHYQEFQRQVVIDEIIEDEEDSEDAPTITDLDVEAEEKYTDIVDTDQHEDIEEQLKKLRETFVEIWNENEGAPDDEKLEKKDFIIDSEYVKSVEKQHDQEVKSLKKEIERENNAKEILLERVVKECHEPMLVHSKIVVGLEDKSKRVCNFPIKKPDEEEEQLLEKIKFARRVEQIDLVHRRKYTLTANLEGGIEGEDQEDIEEVSITESPRSEMDTLASGSEAHISDISKTNQQTAKYIMSEYDIKNHTQAEITLDDEDLLYQPTDLYTRQRKVSQIRMLNGLVKKKKVEFNGVFNELVDLKMKMKSKINRSNALVSDIVDELELNKDDYIENIDDVEVDLLKVKDSEVPVDRYVSAAERARQEEAVRLERERLEAGEKGEMIRRALDDMMDGQLEDTNKKVSGLDLIEKPACYDKPEDQLEAAEKKAIQEYDEKVKHFMEEETRKRKQQEAKLKNALNDIADTKSSFDKRLHEVLNIKLDADTAIYELELKIIKLSQSILQHETFQQTREEHKQLEKKLEDQNTEMVQIVQRYSLMVQDEEKLYEEMQREYNELDKQIKNILSQSVPNAASSENHQEAIDKLYRMFKARPKLKLPQRQELLQQARHSVDPYADVELEQNWEPSSLNAQLRKPDNVPEPMWRRFVEERRHKIMQDYLLRLKFQDLQKKKGELDRLNESLKDIEEVISKQIKDRNKFNEAVTREQFNLDYMFRFKQGQVEIEPQAVVPDYGRCVLIPSQLILDLNKQIVHQARTNIEQMRKSMDVLKKISKTEWKIDEIEFQIEEMEDQFQRFQMLRVTKQMQNVLRVGNKNKEKQERERERLADMIEHTKTNLKQRLKEKKRVLNKMESNIDRMEAENSTLKDQLVTLHELVDERTSIHQLQSTTATKAKQDRKMKQLRMERRLGDISQFQEKQLKFLREEIDRLRERTFPSFAVVQTRRSKLERNFPK
mmetsp:Transcript_8703/g.12866  ORF Transcript_8703/g.12866 Transcript_8703/m.12866 type:complete len:1656 (-) Transcript_8703:34-5001(-)